MKTALFITLLGGNPFAAARSAARAAGAKLWYAEAPANLTGHAFQDSLGATAAVAADQMGLWLSREQPAILGADQAPALSTWTVNLTAAWADAGGGVWSLTDTVGGQSRPGIIVPTSQAAGWYQLNFTIGSVTGATQVRIDQAGATDVLVGAGTHSRIVNLTGASFPRFRLEDTSTTIGDGFTLSAVTFKPVLQAAATQATAANRPTLTAQANAIVTPVYDATNDALTFALASAGTPDVVTFTDTGEVTGYDSATTTAFVLGQTKLAGKKVFLVVAHASAIPAAALAKARKLAGVLRGSAY